MKTLSFLEAELWWWCVCVCMRARACETSENPLELLCCETHFRICCLTLIANTELHKIPFLEEVKLNYYYAKQGWESYKENLSRAVI